MSDGYYQAVLQGLPWQPRPAKRITDFRIEAEGSLDAEPQAPLSDLSRAPKRKRTPGPGRSRGGARP
eukprot:14595425-Alexandrium_andersonii.AAC.1